MKQVQTMTREGRKSALLQGDELELAIKEALESHLPWAKICHKFHVGTKTVTKVRDKYLESRISAAQEEQIVRSEGMTSNDPKIEAPSVAKAFRLLDKGISPHELVEKLGFSPEVAEETNDWYLKLRHQPGTQHCADCFNSGWMAAVQDMLEDYKSRALYPNGVLRCRKCGDPINLDLDNSTTYVWKILSEANNSA
jgi:hypothetical protein